MYMTSIFFLSETPWPIKGKFYVEPPSDIIYNIGLSDMTKIATIPNYVKILQFVSSPELLKPGMQNRGLKLYEVHINDEPGLTLTYFMARSHWTPMPLNGGKQLN